MKRFKSSKGFVWSPEFGATIISVLVLIAIPTTLYLTHKSQDTRQQASGNVSSAIISIDPQSGVYSVGQKFAANVLIHGGVEDFSGAKASIGITSNLTVDSLTLTTSSANGCNFIFTNPMQKPSIKSLSFYGILTDTNVRSCTLYTIILTATSPGNASIYINDADVLSGKNGQSIFKEAKNANFIITP